MSITLSSGSIGIQLDAERGTIQRLVHHRFGIDLITEPRLAANFRLLAPLKEWRGHYIYGRQQKLKDCRRTANGLELVYGPLISSAGEFDIRLVFSIVVDQDDVQFSYEIENHSGTQIEEVILPLIGGLANESEDEAWRFFSTDLLGKGKEWRFYKDFPGTYLGPAKPIWFGPYPHQSVLPWVDIYHPGRRVGFYLGCHNPQADWSSPFLELTPSTCYRKGGQRWPHRSDLPSDQPLGLTMGWATFPFVNPGETKVGPPVVAHFHEGTWYAAADYYRNWFQQHWPVNRKTSWLGREDAWQSNIIPIRKTRSCSASRICQSWPAKQQGGEST